MNGPSAAELVGKRDLLDTEHLERAFVERLLAEAASFEEVLHRPVPVVPALRGKTVAVAFFEPSTRTRVSFELAAKRLSADVISFSAAGSSVAKGESLIDTASTLRAMGADCVVVRHGSSGAAAQIARVLDVPVVNAGDGSHQHPTQALADLYTVRKHKGDREGLRVTVVGDILHSRVARSVVTLFASVGHSLTCVGPPTLLPRFAGSWPCSFQTSLDDVLPETDVLMLLRLQFERGAGAAIGSPEEYRRRYCIDAARKDLLPKGALIMHPGPVNRGIEVSSDVLDSEKSVVTEQVSSGVAVRMAVLYLLCLGEGEPQDGGASR